MSASANIQVAPHDNAELCELAVWRASTPEGIEAARELHATLALLSEKYRAVVILHDIEERPVAEIAEIVGSGELTVRSRLRDGRKQLAKLLFAHSRGDWMPE